MPPLKATRTKWPMTKSRTKRRIPMEQNYVKRLRKRVGAKRVVDRSR